MSTTRLRRFRWFRFFVSTKPEAPGSSAFVTSSLPIGVTNDERRRCRVSKGWQEIRRVAQNFVVRPQPANPRTPPPVVANLVEEKETANA
jgi:hypothetical protein